MNYISEINSFYDWLETNDIPKSAVALWNALMHINNKAKWAPSFEVAISTLEFKTKFKRSELFVARNVLVQKGRIRWKPRGGNLSATYEIIPLCVHNTDASMDANTDTNRTQVRTQTHTINKQNKTDVVFKDKKNAYRENVHLTEKEHQKFLSEHGEEFTRELYDYLSNYKKEKNYKTKDDNLTIRRWVIDAVREKKQKVKNGTNQRPVTSKAARNQIGFDHILNSLKSDFEADGGGAANSAA